MANTPEKGKRIFYEKMERELQRVLEHYPTVRYLGIADGAQDQWEWLERHTSWSILDFWHASECINLAAPTFECSTEKQKSWADDVCHRLKLDQSAASTIIEELREVCRTA